jgi:hypothetical protein
MGAICDEVVCIVQPGKDCTLMFAESVARACPELKIRVYEHSPPEMGMEFSIVEALTHCAHVYCFRLDADESYVGPPLKTLVKKMKAGSFRAAALPRLHAVGLDGSARKFFKVERWTPQVRLVNKDWVNREFEWDLHMGLNQAYADQPTLNVAQEQARIIELKSPSRHYASQIWLNNASPINDYTKCRALMSKRDRKLAEAIWKAKQ